MADIGVFRIDTTTGIATQVSTVTGLPDDNFVIDAATFGVPEPSTLALLIVALLVAGGGAAARAVSLSRIPALYPTSDTVAALCWQEGRKRKGGAALGKSEMQSIDRAEMRR